MQLSQMSVCMADQLQLRQGRHAAAGRLHTWVSQYPFTKPAWDTLPSVHGASPGLPAACVGCWAPTWWVDDAVKKAGIHASKLHSSYSMVLQAPAGQCGAHPARAVPGCCGAHVDQEEGGLRPAAAGGQLRPHKQGWQKRSCSGMLGSAWPRPAGLPSWARRLAVEEAEAEVAGHSPIGQRCLPQQLELCGVGVHRARLQRHRQAQREVGCARSQRQRAAAQSSSTEPCPGQAHPE